jgi:hypothetical protein
MQEPHKPVPQPNLVPVSFSPSRITHNNGVAGGASVDAALPFTLKLVVIVSSLPIDDGRAMRVVNDRKVESLKFDARRQHWRCR